MFELIIEGGIYLVAMVMDVFIDKEAIG